MPVSGYCYAGDERDDYDDSATDHDSCLASSPFDCDCECHDWTDEEWAEAEADAAREARDLAAREDSLPGED